MAPRRPAPDQGVDAAVESATSNVKVKRMVLFGLRALSELCTPPRGRYLENSLRAIELNAVPALAAVMSNFPDDEELAELVVKTCWGISRGLLEYNDAGLLEKFLSGGGANAACAAINSIPSDPDITALAFQLIGSFQHLGAPLAPAVIAPGMIRALQKAVATGNAGDVARIFPGLSAVAESAEGAAAISAAGGLHSIAQAAALLNKDGEQIDPLCTAVTTTGKVAAVSGGDTQTVLGIKSILELNKGRKKITDACAGTLAQMLSLDQLQTCLQTLQSTDVTVEDRDAALELLGAMSYVTEFASAIVEAGSIPLLVQAVTQTVEALAQGAADEAAAHGLIGTVTLLGRIARNPEFAPAVYEAGSLTAIGNAIQAVTHMPEAFAACCSAMASLCAASEEYAVEAYTQYLTGTLLTTLYEQAGDVRVHEAALDCVGSLCLFDQLIPSLIAESAAEIVSYSMQYAQEEFNVQMSACRALARLVPHVYTTASIYEFGGFQGLAGSLQANAKHEDLVLAALRVTQVLSAVPDAKGYIADPNLVDAILYSMLLHSKNTAITGAGGDVLDSIATEADAKRHSTALAGALQNATADPDAALRALAAAGGLCRVKRLMESFERNEAGRHLSDSLRSFVKQPGRLSQIPGGVPGDSRVSMQERLLRDTASTLATFAMNAHEGLDSSFYQGLSAFSGAPKETGDLASKSPETTSAVFGSLAAIAGAGRIRTEEGLRQGIDAVLQGLKNAGDNRHVVEGFLMQLEPLLRTQNGIGVKYFVDQGAVPILSNTLRKTQFNSRAQAHGFRAVRAILEKDQNHAEQFRRADMVNVIQSTLRTHTRDTKIRQVIGPILAFLIPDHELDEMISGALDEARRGVAAGNQAQIASALLQCTDLGVSPEGAKALARHGAADLLDGTMALVERAGSDPHELGNLCSQVAAHMVAQRPGQIAMGKSVKAMIRLIEYNEKAQNEDALVHTLRTVTKVAPISTAADELVAMRTPKKAIKIALKFSSNPEVSELACTAIGQLAKRPQCVVDLVSSPDLAELLEHYQAALCNPGTPRSTLTSTCRGLQSILAGNSIELAQLLAQSGILDALYQVIRRSPEDLDIVRPAAQVMRLIGDLLGDDTRAYYAQAQQANWNVRELGEAFSEAMKCQLKNVDVVINLTLAMSHLIQQGEPGLKESGFPDQVRDAVLLAEADDKGVLESAAAMLLNRYGAPKDIRSTMQQVQEAASANDTKAFNEALEKLSFYLLGQVEDPGEALAEEEAVWQALTAQWRVARQEENIRTLRNIANVAKFLIEHGESDASGYRGAWYFSQSLLPEMCDTVNTGGTVMGSKRLITSMMQAMTYATSSEAAVTVMVGTFQVQKLLDLLETHQNDSEVCASILNLLTTLYMNDAGIAELAGSRRDILDLLARIADFHRGRIAVIVPVCQLAGAIVATMPAGAASAASVANGRIVGAIENSPATLSGQQTYLDANAMDAFAAMAVNPVAVTEMKRTNILRKCGNILDGEPQAPRPGELKADLSPADISIRNHLAYLRLCEAFAMAGHAAYVHEKGASRRCLDITVEFSDDPIITLQGLRTLTALGLRDVQGTGADLAIEGLASLFGAIDPSDVSDDGPLDPQSRASKLLLLGAQDGVPDPNRAHAIVHLLHAVSTVSGADAYLLAPQTKRLIKACASILQDNNDVEGLQMVAALDVPQNPDVDPEDPNAITLKQIHDWLKERLSQTLPIDPNSKKEPLLLDRFTMVFQKMNDYVALRLTTQDFAGQQVQWGARSWVLFLEESHDLLPTFIEWGVPTLLMNYINTQSLDITKEQDKEVSIATVPSMAIAAIAGNKRAGAEHFAKMPGVAASCVHNVILALESDTTRTDEHVIPRLEMIEKIAYDRTIFRSPEVIRALARVWNYCDSNELSSVTLRHVFRAMRRVVCDDHTEACVELHVPERLIAELRKDFDNPLLIDGFFLLGVLSVDNHLKTVVGQHRGVEESLDILANHINDAPGEGVVTNAQLALANLVVGHKMNTNAFVRHNGLAWNVRVLRERGQYYDETNAAAALLTNACFRREDVKAAYGSPEIGAPAALAYAISCYDGGTDAAALRCLNNMFKAISNMSLYTPNVELFLDSGLETAYYNLLTQSQELSDEVVKTGLFTLSNLTWENKPENMAKFGIIVPPLIQMTAQQGRQDPGLFAWSLETLNFLCRLPANSLQFAEYGGCELCMNMIEEHGTTAAPVLQQAMAALGTCARQRENIAAVIAADPGPTFVRIFENGHFAQDTPPQTRFDVLVITLRALSRIVCSGGREVAFTLSEEGVLVPFIWYFLTLANTEEDPPSLVVVESLRCLLAFLASAQGDDPEKYQRFDDILDQIEVDTKKPGFFTLGRRNKGPSTPQSEEIATNEPLTKPPGERGYEVIKLSKEDAVHIVDSIMLFSRSENLRRNDRFVRSALGVLSYFVAENIPSAAARVVELSEPLGQLIGGYFDLRGYEKRVVMLVMLLVANAGYHQAPVVAQHMGKNSEIFKRFSDVSKKLTAADKIERERALKLRARCEDFIIAWRCIQDGDDGTVMRKYASYDIDLGITEWSRDPYPNGVHDLPMKEDLRRGGRLKIIVDEKTRDSFFWKANQTLSMLQWRIEKDKNIEKEAAMMDFDTGIPVSKITSVARGLSNELLKKAAKKQRGVTADLTLVIQGPPTEDFPQGFDFGIKCKTKAEREQFLEWLLEWRDAITY